MNRICSLAAAVLISCSGLAQGQVSKEDVLKAHTKVGGAYGGGSTASDLMDWKAYNRAGWRAIDKGHYDTAESEFRAAIKAARRPSLDDPRMLARSYADYAWAIQKQGRYSEAEPLAKWALVAREASLESSSPAIAQSINQLATLYYEIGRFSEAEPLLKRASSRPRRKPRSRTRKSTPGAIA